jgi:PAS domain S-box-containing protein
VEHGHDGGEVDRASHVPTSIPGEGRADDMRVVAGPEPSVQLLRAVLATAPVTLMALDQDGIITLLEGHDLAAWVVAPAALVGRSLFEVFPDQPEITAPARRALAGEALTTTMERRGILVELRWTPLRTAAGAVGAAVAVAMDITERIRAEQALRESDARQAAMLRAIPDLLFRINRAGEYLDVRASQERLLFVPREGIIGHTVGELLPPAVAHACVAALERALQTGTPQVMEYQLPVPEGLRSFEARVVVSGPDEVLIMVRDVTEHKQAEVARRRAEEALARANTELEVLLRVLPIGIGIADDPAISRIRMNPAFAQLLGLPVDANASLGAPEGERPATFRVLQGGRELALDELPFNVAAATGREVRDMQVEVIRDDGVRLTQLVYTTPLFDEQGRVRGAVGAHLDITERVQAERQRDMLLASMAHDLKNPLTALSWLAQVLRAREGTMASSERVGMLDVFVESTQQMLRQINELGDAARIQMRQPLALDRQVVDLATLVARVASQMTPAHTIRVEGVEASRQGLYDEVRLGRALSNVLGNAVKYSAADEKVICALSFVGEPTGTWAVIRVRDHGIGIPAADIAHVFEPYYRASNARGQAEGTGLGLAGVRQIVAAHGGTVTLESVEGAGTTVTLQLPHRLPDHVPGI